MNDKTKTAASDLFDQALKNYDQALRMGVKMHEEAGKCWTRFASQASSPQELQKQVSSIANDVIPATQKALEGYLDLLEENSHASVNLLKKGLEALQTAGTGESQNRLVEFCEGTLKSLKSNARAVVELNSDAMDSWLALVKKAAATSSVEVKPEKA